MVRSHSKERRQTKASCEYHRKLDKNPAAYPSMGMRRLRKLTVMRVLPWRVPEYSAFLNELSNGEDRAARFRQQIMSHTVLKMA
jgi:hypothetical protein